jgi:hypothetical protein
MAYKLMSEPNLNPMLEDMLRILNIANRRRILAKHQQLQVFNQFIMLAGQMGQVVQSAGQMPPEQIAGVREQMMGQVMQLLQQASGFAKQPQPMQ